MQEAKRLLLNTKRSVTDISLEVGYGSLGTFSRVFSDFVGFAPVQFRGLAWALTSSSIPVQALSFGRRGPSVDCKITGEIYVAEPLAMIVVGLFPHAIPRSRPLDCMLLTNSRRFAFGMQTPGRSFVCVVGLSPKATLIDALLGTPKLLHLGSTAINTTSKTLSHSMITLRPRRLTDPPLLLAFPLLLAHSLLT
jgi:AraC family transcriptional regulator